MLKNGFLKENRYKTVYILSSVWQKHLWLHDCGLSTNLVGVTPGDTEHQRSPRNKVDSKTVAKQKSGLSWLSGSQSCSRRPTWPNQGLLTEFRCWKEVQGESRSRDGLSGRNVEALPRLSIYAIKLICTSTEEGLRETMAGWGNQMIPCLDPPRLITEAICPQKTHLHKIRGDQGHKGR